MVKTKIGPSGIAGISLFADQIIPKGTVVWRYQECFDLLFFPHLLRGGPTRIVRGGVSFSCNKRRATR